MAQAVPKLATPDFPGLDRFLEQVESEMNRLAERTSLPLFEIATKRFVSSGGKRLRSTMIYATALAFGDQVSDDAVRAAAAVELVHVGSLVHDDLMDDAEERRAVRTVNSEWGADAAILVGDYCLANAGLAALEVSPEVGHELVTAVADMSEGQMFEALDSFDVNRTVESALRSLDRKTGALFRSCGAIGAVVSGATPEVRRAVAQYCLDFGRAFQVIDDLLDIASTNELLGKPVGNDIRQGTYTLPLIRAMQLPDFADVRELIAANSPSTPIDEADLSNVLHRVRDSGLVEEIFAEVDTDFNAAYALLDFPGTDFSQLHDMLDRYLTWSRSLVGRTLNL